MPMHSPAHPGQLIREFIDGINEETGQNLTVGKVAEALSISRNTLSSIINGHSSVTAAMVLKLAAAFQTTTPEHWIRLQENCDLAEARKNARPQIIKVLCPIPDAVSASI